MAAPDPSLVVDDPKPLNLTTFPFRVRAFPAADMVENGIFRVVTSETPAAKSGPEVKFRHEN